MLTFPLKRHLKQRTIKRKLKKHIRNSKGKERGDWQLEKMMIIKLMTEFIQSCNHGSPSHSLAKHALLKFQQNIENTRMPAVASIIEPIKAFLGIK